MKRLAFSLAIFLFPVFLIPTSANALAMRYDVIGTTEFGECIGYALIPEEYDLYEYWGDDVAAEYRQVFTISRFKILYEDGFSESGSGSIGIGNIYDFVNPENGFMEDWWYMGQYMGGGGFNPVNLNLVYYPHDVLYDPLSTMPDTFGLLGWTISSVKPQFGDAKFIFSNPTPVPEPSTLLLLAVGLLGIARKNFLKG